MEVVPKRLAFSLNVLNTLSNSIESPPLNASRLQLYFYPLSRVVNKNFEVVNTDRVTPKHSEPKCDPRLFKRAAKEITNIIGNLTRSAFTYTDTDIITLQYKVCSLALKCTLWLFTSLQKNKGGSNRNVISVCGMFGRVEEWIDNKAQSDSREEHH